MSSKIKVGDKGILYSPDHPIMYVGFNLELKESTKYYHGKSCVVKEIINAKKGRDKGIYFGIDDTLNCFPIKMFKKTC